METAGDEADIKASNPTSIHFLIRFYSLELCYFFVVTIWWLLVKKQLKTWCISKPS